MQVIRSIVAPAMFAALVACSATGEAQRPAVVIAALGKAVDGLATETQQRQTTEPFRGLPIVVRNGANDGAETVLAEMLRTRLVDRGVAVEVACPAKCLEITLIEFVSDGGATLAPGQLLPMTGASVAFPGLPRAPVAPLAPGQASAVLATFASRDGNRYSNRQQLIAVLAVAKNPEAAR